MSYFEFWETDADGTQRGYIKNIDYRERKMLFLFWRWEALRMVHFIALACAAPGTIVDVTKWDEKTGGLVYSARLIYHRETFSERQAKLAQTIKTGLL